MATTKKTTAKKTTAVKKTTAKTSPAADVNVGDPAEGLVAPAAIVGRSTGKNSTKSEPSKVARYTTQGRQTVQRVNEAQTMSLEEVAAHALKGKMGTGRDRDDALRQAGHDPAEVTKMMNKLTKEAAPPKQTLPIPNNRRGSSWT